MARFAIVGAGHVADHYMRSAEAFPDHTFSGVWDINAERLSRFSAYWNVPAARGLEDLFTGPKRPDVLINLTHAADHFEVSQAALDAGLPVYSEAPIALSMDMATALAGLARQKNVVLASAPCSILGPTGQAMWWAVRRRLIGTPHLVYAEMDGGYLAHAPHKDWRSESGAPWPAGEVFRAGAVVETAAFSLSWLLAMFGPVRRVQALSATLLANPAAEGRPNGPDFASAVLSFDHGVVARLTQSTVASADRRFRIFGSRGVLSVDDVRSDTGRVTLSRRNRVRSRLVEGLVPETVKLDFPPWANRRRNAPNLMLGPVDMVGALGEGRSHLRTDMALHLNEVMLAIHNAGAGAELSPQTTFEPMEPMPWVRPRQRRRTMDEHAIALGIVGTGARAARMRETLRHVPAFDVKAVTSTVLARAEMFAMEHEIEGAYGDLEAMLAAGGVSAVYVANESPQHFETAMAALSAGKAVLVEHPLAMTPEDADTLIAAARENGVALMEALWTPLLPAHQRAIALCRDTAFGSPVHLTMDLGQPVSRDASPALFDPSAGGGVLYTRMAHPLAFALTVFGPAREMSAAISLEGEVDVHASIQLEHHGGGVSQLSASLATLMSNTATLAFTEGAVRIDDPVLDAETLTIKTVAAQTSVASGTAEDTAAPPPGQLTRTQLRARLRQSGLARRVNRAVPSGRAETHSYGADPYVPMLTHFAELIAGDGVESNVVSHALSRSIAALLAQARDRMGKRTG